MRVLVTGHRGVLGREVAAQLGTAGHDAVGLDLADGDDVADPARVAERVRGCEAIAHLAAVDEEYAADPALSPPTTGRDAEILRVNIGGTYNLLTAAAAAGVARFVFMSSVDVFGCFMGLGPPRYLPIDDAHPLNPRGPYAWSKLAGEELCRAYSEANAATSVCLRAPAIFTPELYDVVRSRRAENPEFEWTPFWEYGAFIDVRDAASAVLAALTAPISGHHRLLINAGDVSSAAETGPALAARLLPDVPVTPPARFASDPYGALVDSGPARALLSWAPAHRWRPA